MRFLGIDYGTKRIGLAVSDEGGRVAFPLSVVANDERFFETLMSLVSERGISAVVLGESKNYKGEDNPIMPAIRSLAEQIEKECGLEVHYEPEFLTSEEAKRIQGAGDQIDASAAAIFLQSFLAKRAHQSGEESA